MNLVLIDAVIFKDYKFINILYLVAYTFLKPFFILISTINNMYNNKNHLKTFCKIIYKLQGLVKFNNSVVIHIDIFFF